MNPQHTDAERARNHAAGQRKITHWCTCGRKFIGNAAWWSHQNANPGSEHRFAGTVQPVREGAK